MTQATAWTAQNARQIIWNDVASEAVQFFPGQALYLPTDQLFAPADRFFTWNRTPVGTWIRARKLDNTHMCPYGAAEFGALVVNDLTPVLGLSPMAPDGSSVLGCTTPTSTTPPAPVPTTSPHRATAA